MPYPLAIAGAGSGKTRTLTYRVARLLETGVPPSQILLLTFTNKAAKEMLHRVHELTGIEPDAFAVVAPVDLYVMVHNFPHGAAAPRAFHEMGRTLHLRPRQVQRRASLLEQLRIDLREVLLFVSTVSLFHRETTRVEGSDVAAQTPTWASSDSSFPGGRVACSS